RRSSGRHPATRAAPCGAWSSSRPGCTRRSSSRCEFSPAAGPCGSCSRRSSPSRSPGGVMWRSRARRSPRRPEPFRATCGIRTMEVILRETVQHLGAAGDVVKVKDGYARNYLLPKGLAYLATEANKKKIAYEAERIARQRADEKSAAETEATRIAEVRLSFAVKVGEE